MAQAAVGDPPGDAGAGRDEGPAAVRAAAHVAEPLWTVEAPDHEKVELSQEIAESTIEAARAIPSLRDELDKRLGWKQIGPQPAAGLAQALYFGSGHGSIFKTSNGNPFANPLPEMAA